jgi:very-short-patch-repair endonuclease
MGETPPLPTQPAAERPSPAKRGRVGGGANSAPPPSAGEGQPERSDGRERGSFSKELLRSRARSMRSEPTPAEHRLWQILRAKRLAGYKFKRQLVIDYYIGDFVCPQRRLIVEADGGQHAECVHDRARDAYLKAQDFRILRFWNSDIFNNEEGVGDAIFAALTAPPPARPAAELPSPAEGGRD